jgi:toxin ParE1/3/4
VNPPRFHAGARQDFDEAFAFLHEQSPRAAREFAFRVADIIDLVAGYPEAGNSLAASIRAFPIHPFSHDLVYRIEMGGQLTILAIAHHRRQPGYWRDRLE